jgi:hypothetical protein
MDAEVSEEHGTSIFMVEVCKFRKCLGLWVGCKKCDNETKWRGKEKDLCLWERWTNNPEDGCSIFLQNVNYPCREHYYYYYLFKLQMGFYPVAVYYNKTTHK